MHPRRRRHFSAFDEELPPQFYQLAVAGIVNRLPASNQWRHCWAMLVDIVSKVSPDFS